MDTVLITVCVILFSVCLIELIMLFRDAGRFINCVQAFRYMQKQQGTLKTIIFSTKKLLHITRNILFGKINRKNCDKDIIRIAIKLEGGLGDYLINANWYEYFRAKYVDDTVFVDIFALSKSILSILPNELYHTKVYAGKFLYEENYDGILDLVRIPVVLSADEEKIKQLSPKLHEYIALCKRYMDENRLVWQNLPFLDGFHTAKCVSKGVKRIQEADVYGYLGITEEYKFAIQIKEDENAYLHSLGLDASPFITVHRGWDGAYTKSEHVKAWSLASCGDIIIKLKEQFPGYKIVLFGISKEQAPSPKGADINLLGKTSLEQVKILLKHAACHIDNEGGMVHLRHALHGGPSVVLFGPTSVDLFGYSENINLTSGACRHWCEWLTNDWMFTCTKTGRSGHPCMDAITSDDVIRSMKQRCV